MSSTLYLILCRELAANESGFLVWGYQVFWSLHVITISKIASVDSVIVLKSEKKPPPTYKNNTTTASLEVSWALLFFFSCLEVLVKCGSPKIHQTCLYAPLLQTFKTPFKNSVNSTFFCLLSVFPTYVSERIRCDATHLGYQKKKKSTFIIMCIFPVSDCITACFFYPHDKSQYFLLTRA